MQIYLQTLILSLTVWTEIKCSYSYSHVIMAHLAEGKAREKDEIAHAAASLSQLMK